MKVYVILESFTDYKGGNATSFGVYTSREKAIANLPKAVAERLGCGSIDEVEENFEIKFEDGFVNAEKSHWVWDFDNDLVEFYLQEDELID